MKVKKTKMNGSCARVGCFLVFKVFLHRHEFTRVRFFRGCMRGSERTAPHIYTPGWSLKATDLKETWVMEYLLRGHNCGGQGSRGRPLGP